MSQQIIQSTVNAKAKSEQIKEIALISVFTALNIGVSFVLPMISMFLFVVSVMILKKKASYGLAVMIPIVYFLLDFNVFILLNLAFYPILVYIIHYYLNKVHCSKQKHKRLKRSYFFNLFIVIQLMNIISEILVVLFYGHPMERLFASLPIALTIGLVNVILIGFLSFPISMRVCKILK